MPHRPYPRTKTKSQRKVSCKESRLGIRLVQPSCVCSGLSGRPVSVELAGSSTPQASQCCSPPNPCWGWSASLGNPWMVHLDLRHLQANWVSCSLPSRLPPCVWGGRQRQPFKRYFLFVHRTASHRVGVGEQLHPENVSFSVCQSEQLHILHRILPWKVRTRLPHTPGPGTECSEVTDQRRPMSPSFSVTHTKCTEVSLFLSLSIPISGDGFCSKGPMHLL